jgi:hypothetical protein
VRELSIVAEVPKVVSSKSADSCSSIPKVAFSKSASSSSSMEKGPGVVSSIDATITSSSSVMDKCLGSAFEVDVDGKVAVAESVLMVGSGSSGDSAGLLSDPEDVSVGLSGPEPTITIDPSDLRVGNSGRSSDGLRIPQDPASEMGLEAPTFSRF